MKNLYEEINRCRKLMGLSEGLNLVSKKKYREKIMGNYPDGDGLLIQYWDNGNIKFEHKTDENGSWWKSTRDENGNEIYYEQSDGFCNKSEYNKNGKKIYYEDSDGYWSKREFDENGYEIYFEDSDGVIGDNRPQNINEGLNLVSKKKYNIPEEKIIQFKTLIDKKIKENKIRLKNIQTTISNLKKALKANETGTVKLETYVVEVYQQLLKEKEKEFQNVKSSTPNKDIALNHLIKNYINNK